MDENDLLGGDYAEPYAGGAGIAMELLLGGHVRRVHLNDASFGVYAFWYSILNHTEAFCRRIASASLSIREWRRQKEILSRCTEFDLLDAGFSLFYLNRCNRSGIVSGGVIGGLKQTGRWKIDARFYPNELIRRIEAIAVKQEAISVRNLDAEKFIVTHVASLPERSLVYCDPPYVHKSERLYLNKYTPGDHVRIAGVIQRNIKHPWLVSYDPVPEVFKAYSRRRSLVYNLQHNAAVARLGKEVLFFAPRLRIPVSSSLTSIDSALRAEGLRFRKALNRRPSCKRKQH
jgi:DNA adenine methylase